MDPVKSQVIGRGRGRGRGLKPLLHESGTLARNTAVSELLSQLMKESANVGNNAVEEEKEVTLGTSKQKSVLGIGAEVEEKTERDASKQSTSSKPPEAPEGGVPETIIGAAHEFRMDAILSSKPIRRYFFCLVCGCPAGDECYCCWARGHPICQLCQQELELDKCPCPIKFDGSICMCESALHKYRCLFRVFMFEKTGVGCINHKNGCSFVGVWKDVKSHQKSCEYEMK